MKKKIGLILVAILLIITIGIIFIMFNNKEDSMTLEYHPPAIPQEGVYEVSNYLFWVPTTTIDVRLIINSTPVYQTQDAEIFQEMGAVQSSGGIDPLVRNGSNLIEVYFKPLSIETWPENFHTYLKGEEHEAEVYIVRNDNVYHDGKPYTGTEFNELVIKFALDENGKPVITTPEGQLTKDDLRITQAENGYTKVTASFILKNAKVKAWESGKAYEDYSDRQLIDNAYLAFWNALNQKNWQAVKEIYTIALSEAREQEPMLSEDIVYSMISPVSDIQAQGFRLMQMHPFNQYKIETSDDRKLIRLYIENEQGIRYSPIVFESKDGKGQISIMPWFSIIDGKVVLSLPF